jgi:hypothetical protein
VKGNNKSFSKKTTAYNVLQYKAGAVTALKEGTAHRYIDYFSLQSHA